MQVIVKKFHQLSLSELYEILRLRSEVFVVEQDCVYQDLDGKDEKALHIFGVKNDNIVVYSRCFGPSIYFEEAAIGRILVAGNERKFGYGHEILKASIDAIEKNYGSKTIKLSAQQYLIGFYEAHGFKTIGDGYLEDGIPHIAMVRNGKTMV